MAKLTEEVIGIIKDQGAQKIVATVDKDGVPNVTIKATLMAPDDETLVFADLYGKKSRTFTNLEETKQVSVLVFKAPFESPFPAHQIKGKYAGYQTSGPMFEQFKKAVKESIGADILGVAIIKVDSVFSQSPQDAGKRIV